MNYIVTGDEMKQIEKCAIEEIGIDSLVLMERAALSVVAHMKKHTTKQDKICVVCGSGNNGADGVAIARILLEDKYKVTIVVLEVECTLAVLLVIEPLTHILFAVVE